jgi:hypothetical protein
VSLDLAFSITAIVTSFAGMAFVFAMWLKMRGRHSLTAGSVMTFTDERGELIAVIFPDDTKVFQPDKIQLAAGMLVERLAEAAARAAAEREFGDDA